MNIFCEKSLICKEPKINVEQGSRYSDVQTKYQICSTVAADVTNN